MTLNLNALVYTSRALLGGGGSYLNKVKNLLGSSLIGYWPMNEASGSVSVDHSGQGNNGAYTAVTLGAAGIGDGNTAASFDGTTSFNDIYSAGLAADFNAAEGSLLIWFKVSGAGVWTDGADRVVAQLRADNNNRVFISKAAFSNRITMSYIAGGTSKTTNIGSLTSTDWLSLAITWSVAADEVKAFLNGAQQGSTLTSLGTWSGALESTSTMIGAFNTTPTLVTSGYLAHAIQLNRVATPAEVLAAATV